jgi:hypothetical protein
VVYQVYQDSRKFVWFATDAGVARFDGSKISCFQKRDGLSSNDVVRIKEDSQGRIWFFNLNATLNYFYKNTIHNEKNTPFLDSLKSSEFYTDFFEDKDKTIYFYNNNQGEIVSLDELNRITRYTLPGFPLYDKDSHEPYEGMVVRYLNKDSAGEFYIWAFAGLFKLKDLAESPVLMDTFSVKSVFPLYRTNGYLIVDGLAKLFPWRIYKRSEKYRIDSTQAQLIVKSHMITCALEDIDGIIWISTFDQGVYCYRDNQMIRHFNIRDAQAVIQDHESNIWITSLKDGVYKINPFINQHLHYESSLFQNNGILALNNHPDDGLWCSNGKTLFLLKDNKLFTSDFRYTGEAMNQVVQINSNTLLAGEIGIQHCALEGITLDPNARKVSFQESTLSQWPIKKIAINRKKNKISSFASYILYFIDPERAFDKSKKVWFGERIYNIYYTIDNELLVNSKNNYLYKDDSLVVCEELSRFKNKIIIDHLILNDSVELLNIEGDSLFLLYKKQLFNLSARCMHPIDLQMKYLEYHDPTLFITTTRNIYTCEHPLSILEDKIPQVHPVDLSFRNINDILFSDNRLFIASDDGLTAIPYEAIHVIRTNAPIPYFRSIEINKKEMDWDQPGYVLKGRNRIQINIGSINYSFSPIIYSYILEGTDNEWTIGAGTNIVYENLPRGEYLFKARVRKPTSEWSEPVECAFTIKPTLWRHPAFFVILSIITGGLTAWIIIRRKNASFKQREMDHQMILLEQKALQSMMNPHFIFNALGSIQNFLLQNKPGEAGVYLSQFARLIRQNLGSINAAQVGLEEEVDRIKNYLDLEKLRMGNRFDYIIQMDDSIDEDEELLIPSMIIQPFIENAVWHGISPLESNGWIRLSLSMPSRKAMQIIIEDNGIGMTQSAQFSTRSQSHLHMGMTMTRKRLEIIGKKQGVETSVTTSEAFPGSPHPGTRVVLVVPVAFGEVDG